MLKKLLKYDMRHMLRLWRTLAIITPLIALVSAIAFRFGWNMTLSDAFVAEIIGPFVVMIGTFGVMGIFAVSIVNTVSIATRFSSNFYSDEAYLTFMLPVKREKLLLSKFINAFIWSFAMELMLIICIFIYAIVTPTPTSGGLITFDFLKGFFASLFAALRETPGFTSFLFFSIAFIAFEVVAFQVILLHYCISRVRSGGGIGLWIGINAAMGAVGTVLLVFVSLGLGYMNISEDAEIAAVVLTLCGIMVAIATVGFYLYLKTQDSIKFKLNVE